MSDFERKFGKYAVRDLSLKLIILYLIGYAIYYIRPEILYYMTLNPYAVVHGQVWRLVSWLLIPPSASNLFFIAIMMFFYYSIGTSLERVWGTWRYNVFIFTGILLTIVSAFLWMGFSYLTGSGGALGQIGAANYFGYYSAAFSTYYINMGIFFAYALTFPEAVVLLFFIIPVKVKWLLGGTIQSINGDTSIVSLKWGDWIDRDTCELFITGKKVGNTNVTICDKTETYSVSILVVVTALARPADNVPGEISGLLGENIYVANNRLGQSLIYRDGIYMNNCVGMTTNSNKNIDFIGLINSGRGYKIFGVYPGMSAGVAHDKLGDYGWILIKSGPTSSGTYSYVYMQTGNPDKMISVYAPTSDDSSLVDNIAYSYINLQWSKAG